jgi:hypothetical protein
MHDEGARERVELWLTGVFLAMSLLIGPALLAVTGRG